MWRQRLGYSHRTLATGRTTWGAMKGEVEKSGGVEGGGADDRGGRGQRRETDGRRGRAKFGPSNHNLTPRNATQKNKLSRLFVRFQRLFPPSFFHLRLQRWSTFKLAGCS